ncbi:uncharacterized protein LOC144872544 [Branchiostoma floridae x Branchiostoma japonicum]
MDSFYKAVEKGDVEAVRRKLKTGVPDVNTTIIWNRYHDQTSLHVASRHGKTEVAKLLIEHGWHLEARDGDKYTPLLLAAAGGHTKTCELLLRAGADGTAKTQRKSTALHLAAGHGHTETCELLILFNADVTDRDRNEDTPLHRAAERCKHSTCELLIRLGADMGAENTDGKNPLTDKRTRHRWENLQKQADKEKSKHEELLQTSSVINRLKVFVVGKEKTGKSRLKKSLKKSRRRARFQRICRRAYKPTPGADIGTVHVPGVGEASLWDFAGQSEYALTSSKLMDAENTVFLVLYNIMGDRETQEQEVRGWLTSIETRNPKWQPDVILVATHADQVEPTTGQDRAAYIVKTMQAEFKGLRIADEVILMDCRKTLTPEMDQLKTLLARIKETLLHHQPGMTKLCRKIMKRLPKWRSNTNPRWPVMMWHDFVREVKEIDRFVTEDLLKKSAKVFDNFGEMLFITPTTSDPVLVLDPKWFGTAIFGRIMTPDNFRARTSGNHATKEDIQRVFPNVPDVNLLITLLQELGLCRSSDAQTYTFPWPQDTVETNVVQPVPSEVNSNQDVDISIQTEQSDDIQDREDPGTRNSPKLVNANALDDSGETKVFTSVSSEVDTNQKADIQIPAQQSDELQDREDPLTSDSSAKSAKEDAKETKVLEPVPSEFDTQEEAKAMPTQQTDESRDGQDPLVKNRPQFVESLKNVEPILDHLLALNTLTDEECEVIRKGGTAHDRARALLSTMVTKGEDARQVFLSVLGGISPHLADMLER